MGHKIHVNVLDKDNKILTEARNHACDGSLNWDNFPEGVKWVRYIEVENCIFTIKELRKWCAIMCRWGFKCQFSSKISPIIFNIGVYKDDKFETKTETKNYYSITMLRKDYKNKNHFFIEATIIRTIYYKLDMYNYDVIVRDMFDMNIGASSMQKFILAHYREDYNNYRLGDHGISTYLSSKNCSIKLQKSKHFKMLQGVNASFNIISNVNYRTVVNLVKEKKYQEAYDLFKAEEVEELKNKKKENFNE